MKINVSGRIFDTENIREISIRENQKEVFVTTNEDFYRIKYRSNKDIEDVIYYKQLDSFTMKDLHRALYLLILICEYYVNSKEQCKSCPLNKDTGCILTTIPSNWRENI